MDLEAALNKREKSDGARNAGPEQHGEKEKHSQPESDGERPALKPGNTNTRHNERKLCVQLLKLSENKTTTF